MEKNPNHNQKTTTDPQEDEKNGNIIGDAFDAVFGNSKGGESFGEGEKGQDIERQKEMPAKNTDKPTGE